MADTTVLIDIWRYGKTPRRLGDLTSKLGEAAILVPWITQAEFSRGALFKNVSLERLAEFYKSFHLVPLDQAVMDAYCRLWVEMAQAGHAADYPDLWIAACAVAREIPILTRNPKHFTNVPALKVIGYEIVRYHEKRWKLGDRRCEIELENEKRTSERTNIELRRS